MRKIEFQVNVMQSIPVVGEKLMRVNVQKMISNLQCTNEKGWDAIKKQ